MVVQSCDVGLRSCEISGITVGDVLDSENNVIKTVILKSNQTKGSLPHSAYLSESVGKEIAKYVQSHKEL